MSVTILALDTATEAVALALGTLTEDGVSVDAVCDVHAPRAALTRALPVISEALADAGLTIGDIGEVVVGRGPGSFTGVRIGVSIAKGLAHGLGVPLHGVGTLDAVAWRIVGTTAGSTLVGVIGDAMRGEVYPVLFEVSPQGVRRLEPDTVCAPVEAAARWAALDRSVILTGNGSRRYAEVFLAEMGEQVVVAEEYLWTPSGAGLLQAYSTARRAGEAGDGDPASLLPIYTRLSDAEENERRRGLVASSKMPSSGVADPPDVTR